MEKNIYCITNIGTSKCYYHFFYGVLIPLLYFDIKTKGKYKFNIKINTYSFIKILKSIFKDRVKEDYIDDTDSTMSDKQRYFDLYIKLLKKSNTNDIILNAYDIFTKKPNLENYNFDKYKKLKNNYINYNT